jgi:acetyl esterase/lipase
MAATPSLRGVPGKSKPYCTRKLQHAYATNSLTRRCHVYFTRQRPSGSFVAVTLSKTEANMTLSLEPSASRATHKVRVLRDIAYVTGNAIGPRQRLDLYLPEHSSDRFPVVVSAPGGGLVEGDKANDAFIGERLAAAGFATAVVNYRLSPEVAHPDHVKDLAAAVGWVHRSIADFGGDAGRLFVIGHSAGAYLATLLATELRHLAAENVPIEKIRGIISVSGFYWVERVAPHRAKNIWGDGEDAWLAASPARHLHERLPPALFVHADGDDADRRAQNIDIARAAREAGGTRVESIEIPGRDHRSLWTSIAEPHDELALRILTFLRAHAGL